MAANFEAVAVNGSAWRAAVVPIEANSQKEVKIQRRSQALYKWGKVKMNTVELAKKVETEIYEFLIVASFFDYENGEADSPSREEVPTVEVFKHIESTFDNARLYGNATITARFFNSIISDMKRVGIIGTARGGEVVFLSPYSWKTELRKRKFAVDAQETSAKAGGE